MSVLSKKRWMRVAVVLISACAVTIAVIIYHLRNSQPANELITARVTRGDIENTVSAMGVLQPARFVDVGAQVSGQLKILHVSVGDAVTQEQLLAEIDPQVLSAKVAETDATLDNLKAQVQARIAQLTLREQEHTRNLELIEQDAVAVADVQASRATLESTRAEIEALKAQIRQAQASMATARANLAFTRITAPMSGIVLEVSAKEGQTLNANQQTPQILKIADLDRMTVVAQVSEADVHHIKEGQEAYFTLLGQPDGRWSGIVRQVLPMPEEINEVKFYSVLFDVSNPAHALLPGMTAQVFIVLEKAQDTLLVPASALRQDEQPAAKAAEGRPDAGDMVQVLKADGIMESRPVSLGVGNAVFVQITSGLQEGEAVVTGARTVADEGVRGNGLGGGKGRGMIK